MCAGREARHRDELRLLRTARASGNGALDRSVISRIVMIQGIICSMCIQHHGLGTLKGAVTKWQDTDTRTNALDSFSSTRSTFTSLFGHNLSVIRSSTPSSSEVHKPMKTRHPPHYHHRRLNAQGRSKVLC